MAKKRVYSFKSYNDKIEEGYDNPGFKIDEFEEENDIDTNIDELGDGEDLVDEAPEIPSASTEEDNTPMNTDLPAENLDFGDRQDLGDEEVKIKMSFIQDQFKSYQNLVKNSDSVKLDKTTKEKIVKIYKVMQGI